MDDTSLPQSPDGGIGGQPVVDTRTPGRDLRMLRAAARWNVKPSHRRLVRETMADLVKEAADPRVTIAAARVLVACDTVDARRESTQTTRTVAHVGPDGGPIQHEHRIDLFAQIEQYTAEFTAAALRKQEDAADDELSITDMVAAGFDPLNPVMRKAADDLPASGGRQPVAGERSPSAR